MNKKRTIIILVVGILVLTTSYVIYQVCLPDEILMWKTKSISSGKASTDRAQEAAKRVFDQLNVEGLTKEEIINKIGDPQRSNDSMYNFPFYPVTNGVLVYRFDTGAYGWQFNIHFDSNGKAIHVEKLGIE